MLFGFYNIIKEAHEKDTIIEKILPFPSFQKSPES